MSFKFVSETHGRTNSEELMVVSTTVGTCFFLLFLSANSCRYFEVLYKRYGGNFVGIEKKKKKRLKFEFKSHFA